MKYFNEEALHPDETSLDLRNAMFTFNRNMTNNDDGVEKKFVVL